MDDLFVIYSVAVSGGLGKYNTLSGVDRTMSLKQLAAKYNQVPSLQIEAIVFNEKIIAERIAKVIQGNHKGSIRLEGYKYPYNGIKVDHKEIIQQIYRKHGLPNKW